ncbi:MAG: alpha-N-arabinofuranosidase [Anaerolineae bacterium]|nr:alpha-N-arabinofuranosidase [Anaerolineae bacterium]
MNAKLEIFADKPSGTISPRLYGHFAEHLGRCCYDGLWCVNETGEYSHREDVITALKALPVPLLRWPGGCYADHYHWQDGIGPREQRKRRLGMSCGLQVEDDNSFGTHEFIEFCRRIGAEPYLAGNVGSGSPQELCDWLEYCNATVNTSLVQQRQQNGSAQPFNIRLWGVGNENWGCGGNFDAASYAREYRRFATMLRHVDPTAELVIAGSGDAMGSSNDLDNWNIELIQTLRPHLSLIDHLSIHCYWINGGPESDFTEQQYYNLLTEAQYTEKFVIRTAQMLAEEAPGRKIGIALDEWGVWHPEAREWGPGDVQRRNPVTYEQANTLRDALAVGVVLEAFHRQCQVMSMANLAQLVNVLQAPIMTSGSQMWLTPTYHALHLHTPHIGALALPVETQQADSLPDGSPAVTATASRSDQGLAVTIINRHYAHESTVRFNAAGEQAHARLLSADSANAGNDPHYADRVRPGDLVVNRDGRQWCIDMPPHSMATVILQ